MNKNCFTLKYAVIATFVQSGECLAGNAVITTATAAAAAIYFRL